MNAPQPTSIDLGDRTKLNTLTFTVLALFHVGAIGALFFFSWTNLIVTAVVYWIAVGWGISMGYHRLHTHRGYKVPKAIEYFLAVCGTLALEGGPIYWVAAHRCHHQHSDTDLDPHTPRHGGFWAHMGWIIFGRSLHNDTELNGKYAPDLLKDRFYRLLSEWHWVPLTVLGVAAWILGGFGMMLWVVPLRVVIGQHSTWLVNSATHMWGSRRFSTADDSRNLWWVASSGSSAVISTNESTHCQGRARGVGGARIALVPPHSANVFGFALQQIRDCWFRNPEAGPGAMARVGSIEAPIANA